MDLVFLDLYRMAHTLSFIDSELYNAYTGMARVMSLLKTSHDCTETASDGLNVPHPHEVADLNQNAEMVLDVSLVAT